MIIFTIDRRLLIDKSNVYTQGYGIVIYMSYPNFKTNLVLNYIVVSYHSIYSFKYASILIRYVISDSKYSFKWLFKPVKGLYPFANFIVFAICMALIGLQKIVNYRDFITRYHISAYIQGDKYYNLSTLLI